MRKIDILAIILLAGFITILVAINLSNKDSCEVARADYKCGTFIEVMRENCVYLQANNFTDQDILWYTNQLCLLQNKYHNIDKFDCSSVQNICQPFGVN